MRITACYPVNIRTVHENTNSTNIKEQIHTENNHIFPMVHADFVPLFSLLASSGRNLDSNHISPYVSGAHPKTLTACNSLIHIGE